MYNFADMVVDTFLGASSCYLSYLVYPISCQCSKMTQFFVFILEAQEKNMNKKHFTT